MKLRNKRKIEDISKRDALKKGVDYYKSHLISAIKQSKFI